MVQKIRKNLKGKWGRVSISIAIYAIVTVIFIVIFFSFESDPTDRMGAVFSWVALLLSIWQLFVSPHVITPLLSLVTNVQKSEPTELEVQQGAMTSHFLRLVVTNDGLIPAKNCFGRLIEVWDEEEQISSFEPLYLYWARQTNPNEFKFIDIQQHQDFFFLDIAQADEKTNELKLRVVIPHRLTKNNKYPKAHEGILPKGTYFLRIAVYADNAYHKPEEFTLEWTEGDPILKRGKNPRT
jgi:hypothetical protein